MMSPIYAPRRPLEAGEVPTNKRSPTIVGKGAGALGRGREVAALLLWTTALFLFLALCSFQQSVEPVGHGGDWIGPAGAFVARALVSGVGVLAWAVPIEFVLFGVPFVTGKANAANATRIASSLLIVLLAAALVQAGWPDARAFGSMRASGFLGELFGELARSAFSTAGTFIVGLAAIALILISGESFSFIALVRLIARVTSEIVTQAASFFRSSHAAWREAKRMEREGMVRDSSLPAPPTIHSPAVVEDDAAVAFLFDPPGLPAASEAPVFVTEPSIPIEMPKRRGRKKRSETESHDEPEECAAADESEGASEISDNDEPDAEEISPLMLAISDRPTPKRSRKKAGLLEPKIVDTSSALTVDALDDFRVKRVVSKFELPDLEMLIKGEVDPTAVVDRDRLYENAEKLVQTLAHYGVQGKVEDILPGPTVTTYEVSPAPGTKVSKVASLADDLALALARKVRIVAPIPGKNRIGFELPNEKRVPVFLRDLVEDRRFQTLDVPLPVVLGRDILGNPVYADLASMPHVIVAGATGAGKSVGLNVMLTSLLYRRTPDELRLLMIDPKVVELAPFDRIPHMLLPVVTDMKQASTALKWAVDEMERRYQLFADAGTKNITTYNGWVGKVTRGEIKNPAAKMVLAKDFNGFPEIINAMPGEVSNVPPPDKLPFIVIVVDEFADLMMQQGKEVEVAVARLAQKARAAGMHVILATQRPSVDVITGMIKANFPTRIAYRVAQKVDSRTILDEQGAEHLLGRGDMLMKLNGTNETKRVQCPMITEEEVQLVTDFLRNQGEPVYDENILKPRDDEDSAEAEEDAEQDPLYDDAVRIVADTKRCSTSWLQRKLGLGYNRAARIVEMMEKRGLVGAANGAKDREVFVNSL